jgi:hypothetical protein
MFNGMKLSLSKLNVDRVKAHPAACKACDCYFEWWYELPLEDGLITPVMHALCPIILARPLVIRDNNHDYALMHFDMIDQVFKKVCGDVELDVFLIESEVSDEEIEIISWLYVIDLYEQCKENLVTSYIIMKHLQQYDMEFLSKLEEQRPRSGYIKLIIQNRLETDD